MSYALQLADVAKVTLAGLDSWLAEETLDEIERLTERTPLQRSRIGTSVHDFVRIRGNGRFYVFLVVFPDEAAGVLHVESIGHYVRHEHSPS